MTDPATLTATAIATLAFEAFIKSAAGTAAKETVTGAMGTVKTLRDRIWAKLAGHQQARVALTAVEQEGSEKALVEVSDCLEAAMAQEPAFADEVQQLAQQIVNIQGQSVTTLRQDNKNFGRDQVIINQPQGEIRFGGS